MHTTNIHEAKTHLSSLLEQVASGQEVIISNRGTPVAKLIPYTPKPRKLGMLEDQHFETDDCWHADSEIDALFNDSAFLPNNNDS